MYFSSIENQHSQRGQWWKYFLSGIDNQCGQCSQWWNYFSYCFEYQHSQCSYGKTILHVVFKISIVSANEWWNYFSSDIENQHSQRNERWNYFSSDIENQRSQLTQWWNYFWTPSGRRKGQDKIGSVRPSVRPSTRRFLEILALVFSEFLHGAITRISYAWQIWIFWEKFFLPKNLGKWTKDGPKTGFFLIYWKIWSLIFTEFVP